MAATALIKFTQGLTVGSPGVAFVGVAAVAVAISNDSPTDIQSWKVDLVYVPPDSGLAPGTLAAGNSSTPAANFTPDVAGSYRVVLTVYTGPGQAGGSDKDIRVFAVPDELGFIYPPYQQLPPKLPVTGSGLVGSKPDELNVGGQPYGWDGDGTDGLLLDFIKSVSAHMVMPSLGTQAGIVASTTQTQGQGQLTRSLNQVATVANANDTVTLPPAETGKEVIVINGGANTLRVYPATGDNLGAGVNTPTTQLAGVTSRYLAYDATNWVKV